LPAEKRQKEIDIVMSSSTTNTQTAPKTPVEIISDRRLAANRANAALSTGPRTQEGKAASSRNAVSHGLTAAELTIFNWESPEKYAALRTDYYTRFSPIDTAEADVIDRLIDSTWRRRRALVIETTLFDLAISDTREATEEKYGETSCGALHLALAFKNRHGEGVWDAILRLLNSVDCAYSRALRDLQKLQGDRFNILPQRPEQQDDEAGQPPEAAVDGDSLGVVANSIPTESEYQRQEHERQQQHPASAALSTHNKIFEIAKQSQSEPRSNGTPSGTAPGQGQGPKPVAAVDRATAENRRNEPIITITSSRGKGNNSNSNSEGPTDAVQDPHPGK
jgi:hypothetical protein